MEKAGKNKRIGKILLILLLCLADIGWAAAVLYAWKRNGTVLSVKTASADIPGIFVQNIIVSAVPIFLFIICLAVLKKEFFTRMYFKVSNKKQKYGIYCADRGVCGKRRLRRFVKDRKEQCPLSRPQYSVCRHAHFFLCGLGRTYLPVSVFFRFVPDARVNRHGLFIPVPEREVRHYLGAGAGACHP